MLFELWRSRVETKDQLSLLDILETLLQLLSKSNFDSAPPAQSWAGQWQQSAGAATERLYKSVEVGGWFSDLILWTFSRYPIRIFSYVT